MYPLTCQSVTHSHFLTYTMQQHMANYMVHLHISLSMLIKESLSVRHANNLPVFSPPPPPPRPSPRTTASLPYTFNVHCTFGCYALEAQVYVHRYAANPQRVNNRPYNAGLTNPISRSCSRRMQVSQLCVSRVVSEVFEDFLAKLFD